MSQPPRDPSTSPLLLLSELPLSPSILLQFVINLKNDPDSSIGRFHPFHFATALLNLDLRSLCLALSKAPCDKIADDASKALALAGSFAPINAAIAAKRLLIEDLGGALNPLLVAFQERLYERLSTRELSVIFNQDDGDRCHAMILQSPHRFGFFKVDNAFLVHQSAETAEQARSCAALLSRIIEESAEELGAHERVVVCLQRGALAPEEFTPYYDGYSSIDDRLFADLERLRETRELEASIPISADRIRQSKNSL